MGYLAKKRCYLSAPIEYAEGVDPNWRKNVVDTLRNEYSISLFDPSDDPKQKKTIEITKAKEEKDYGKIKEIATSFVHKDLCMVDRSDFIIAYLPHRIPTTGTHHEIITSSNAKKPTLLVSDDKRNIPVWYYGFIPLEFMFSGWEELFKYLNEVDSGCKQKHCRWSFVYDLI